MKERSRKIQFCYDEKLEIRMSKNLPISTVRNLLTKICINNLKLFIINYVFLVEMDVYLFNNETELEMQKTLGDYSFVG